MEVHTISVLLLQWISGKINEILLSQIPLSTHRQWFRNVAQVEERTTKVRSQVRILPFRSDIPISGQ